MIVCIDVDGTLIRHGDGERLTEPNWPIVNLAMCISQWKPFTVVIWSGGGEEYARGWRDALGLHGCIAMAKDRFIDGHLPDLVIDDEEGWGRLQLIVKRGNGPAIIGEREP